jgi:hypothetical protein
MSTQVFVGKSEGKKPFERPRRIWNNNKVDLTGMGWDGEDWIHLAQGRDR